MKRYVICNLTKEVYHRYPKAPDAVWYLRNLHRHLLHIEVTVEVVHNERDIEFIMLKHEVERYYDSLGLDSYKTPHEEISCEQIAELIISMLRRHYGPDRDIAVSVMEDGENGARLIDYK